MRVFGMVLLCETLCSFAPLLAPCSPHLPRPASSMCPSCVSTCPVVVFFFFEVALPAAPARPACAPCSFPCYPVPLPCAPSLACLPSHSPSRCRPCLYVCPPCLYRAVTRVCHPRALPLPLPLAPTLSPGCSLGPRLSPHPCCLAPCVGGGGVYLWSGLWPCPRSGMAVGCLRTMSHRMCRMNTERTPGRRMSNSRRCICIVEPSRIDQVRTPLHLLGVPWRRWPPRPGVVYPSEQGARKLNVFIAARSCRAESFAAMYQVGG